MQVFHCTVVQVHRHIETCIQLENTAKFDIIYKAWNTFPKQDFKFKQLLHKIKHYWTQMSKMLTAGSTSNAAESVQILWEGSSCWAGVDHTKNLLAGKDRRKILEKPVTATEVTVMQSHQVKDSTVFKQSFY